MRGLWSVTGVILLLAIGLIRGGVFDPQFGGTVQWETIRGERVVEVQPEVEWLDTTLPPTYDLKVWANSVTGTVGYGVVLGAADQYWGAAVSSSGMVRIWEEGKGDLLPWQAWPIGSFVGYVGEEQKFWIKVDNGYIELWVNREHLWSGTTDFACAPCQIGIWGSGFDDKGIINIEKVLLFYD